MKRTLKVVGLTAQVVCLAVLLIVILTSLTTTSASEKKCVCFFGLKIINNEAGSDRYLNEIAILRPGNFVPLSEKIHSKIKIKALFADYHDKWIAQVSFKDGKIIDTEALNFKVTKSIIKKAFYFTIPQTNKHVKIEYVTPKTIHVSIDEHTP